MVIHGTNGVMLKDNVAFHVEGHCFYLEDGVEEHNWLEHNFAGFVHPIGYAAGGNDQTGTTHVQVSRCSLLGFHWPVVWKQQQRSVSPLAYLSHLLLTASMVHQDSCFNLSLILSHNAESVLHLMCHDPCLQSSSLIQPADAAASGFYSGNLNNVWLRNAASGGFAGFSFPTLPKPIKVNRGDLQRPFKSEVAS